jgi:hypothetical protein
MKMTLRERVKYLREFNQARRQARRDNPGWSEDEVCAAALEQMQLKYGDNPDWQTIVQMILEFIMSILPFFFTKG